MTERESFDDADRQREELLELLLAEEDLAVAPATVAPRPPDAEPELSYGQERLWFLQEFESDTAALSIRAAVRITGPLDVFVLRRSLDDLLERHDSLRTTIRSEGGRPVPEVQATATMPLRVDDLTTAADRDGCLAEILAEESGRTFDLAVDLPIMVRLIQTANDEHVLSVVMHHVASDGWSFNVFFRDLGALYSAHVEDRLPSLPELPIEYGDYSAWQRSWITGDKLERQVDYWRRQLDGPLPLCEIPPDFARPARHTFDGGSVEHLLPAEVSAAVRSLASAAGVTPFMVMLAAFDVLVARRSGDDDIIVGTPVAGRVRPELEDMIGMFLNTLVLRMTVADDPTFAELVEQVRDVSVGAFDNQDVPFERLLIELQPPRDLSRTPFFQVFFNMMTYDMPADTSLAGLDLDVLSQPDIGSKFDVTLYVNDRDGNLDLVLVYNRNLYRSATMQQFLDQYVQLLEVASADPGRRISEFSLLTKEAIAVLPDPTEPLDATWHGSVPAAVRRHAAAMPEKIAVEDGSTSWRYRELSAEMDRLATLLRRNGVGEGDVVAVYGHRSAALVSAVVGSLASGAAYLLLDPSYPPGRLVRYLRTSRPAAWVALDAAGPPDPEVVRALDELGVAVRTVLGSEPDAAEPDPQSGREELAAITDRIGPDSPACVTFTSGSTGEPKAVVGRHGSLTHFLPWQSERFGMTSVDRFSMLSGLAHDPIQRDMFWPLWIGASVVVPDAEQMASPGWLADWLRLQRVTVAHLTPAMGQLITESVPAAGRVAHPVDSLRLAMFIGEALTRSDITRFRALAPIATVVNLYGTTETQRASGHHVVDSCGDDLTGSSRRPREILPLGTGIPGVQLLVRSETGAPAGFGEIGEVWFRSHHLALGYLDRPADTAARFVDSADGAGTRQYRTGDAGRYDANGEIEFFGRRDDQVQLRGFRVELGEIRAVLIEHAAVRDAVVQASADSGRTRLVAHVVPTPGATVVPDDIRQFARHELPAHMVPSDIFTIPRIPLTPNGKLDRAALPAPAAATSGSSRRGGAPRDDLERNLVELWQEVLGRPSVGIHDNFFDLGGYSLLATRLFAMIEAATGQRIPVSALFQAPTIAELAEVFRDPDIPEEWDSLVPIQPRGSEPPFFYVAPYVISVLQFANLGVELGPDQPLYGIQPQGLDGRRPVHTRIEDMATEYIREMKTVQPHGPYRIGGHCSGSWVAFEMARQLEAAGEELDTVLLVDQGPPGVERAIEWPSYLVGRLNFYFRDGRLRHAVAWKLRIALHRLRLQRLWNPASEYVAEVRRVHREAYVGYVGGVVHSDLVLVRSEETLALRDKDWYAGWATRTTGEFHETRANGTHANLLERPYVSVLADRMRWAFSLRRTTGESAAAEGRESASA